MNIGLTYTGSEDKQNNYVRWLKRDGAVDIITLSAETKENKGSIEDCDALVLSGGIDIHPGYYNSDNIVYPNKPQQFYQKRDAFEKNVFATAQKRKIPVLGICRGLQLINCILGGNLQQDLAGKNSIHKAVIDEGRQFDKAHGLHITAGTLLAEIAGTDRSVTNSAHHQCVSDLANDLVVNCISDDGVIEGLEWKEKKGKPFLFCVQWHPERFYEFQMEESALSAGVRKLFIEAVKKIKVIIMKIINPATQEVIKDIAEDTKEQIAEKFATLQKGQPAWAAKTVQQRVDVIQKFYDLLDEEKDELAKTLTAEVGKPLQQSYNEINGARSRIKFFIDNAVKYLSEEWMVKEGGTKEKIVYEPLGVIANISAWNYPYLVGTNVFITALIGGNAVLYKPSEYSLLTGLHIQRLFYKAGVPENVFIVAAGAAAVGEAILALPLNGYFFTGSYNTGKYIAEKTAHKLVPVQLELGGKDPLYIADDVEDVKAAAIGTADGAFYNNGQSCCSVERIYVHEKIYDEYIAAFTQEVKSWKTGSPTEEGVYIGPLTRQAQIKVLEHQVHDAVEKGATILTGGKKISGNYFEPTVLTDVTNDMAVMRDESFGPIIGIMKVKSDEEAVALMQDTEYGLTAGVYSKTFDRAEKIIKQLNTGTVYWNCCDRVSAALPWSGRKNSGLGATLSHQGIYAFVQPKSYHLRG